ncbi:MAG: DUF2723 domain-containing protein, partial [Bacteroidales bacterium]|nr:DUF2723 domain-containing protein [Bacteroidales bacterium]
MQFYKRLTNISGWIIFGISALLYFITLEPTVSLWDCGEFTAAAYKLQVGHPPGAPFYLMLARIFAIVAPDKAMVAMFINSLSAIASAFTVLFLFWSITHLARKILIKDGIYTKSSSVSVVGSAAIGALSFCVSDSFWFSAVEAEVYALSSLFTSLVFWCILKWEDDDGNYANRWIILIAYLMGLSIGVHLLNLLAVPAIGMVFYFRKYKITYLGIAKALFISFLILFGILYIVIPGTIKLAAVFEIIVVNSFAFPLNSGLILFLVTAIFIIYFLFRFSARHKLMVLHTSVLCISVMLIGYSSYAMIIIRAQANTPLNTGNPSNVLTLFSYLNREQYGNRPLLYGPYFNAPISVKKIESSSFVREKGKYVRTSQKKAYEYDQKFKTFFPRMYSSNPNHIEVYKNWGTIDVDNARKGNGSDDIILKPTFSDNLEFFVKYQVGYMYLRYFMWNFAGKQNDMQSNGGILKGNWVSGFDFIDKWLIGPQKKLPEYMKNNPGRNHYFFLPLLLGIIGMVFQFKKSKRYFGVIAFLFVLTGLAIVVYTNQTPLQPRERDYVYIGSFYAFCIWIGLGALSIIRFLQQRFKAPIAIISGVIISLVVPTILFSQNLDDHNRNGRYIVRDMAYNYLISCAPNAILFTSG